MSGVNKAIIIGHLGKDPEVRRTQAGAPVATFRVATSESWKDKATGERKQHTDWHSVVVFNEALVGVAEKFLRKGSKVYVEGAMKTREWTDAAGTTRFVTEVVLSGFAAKIVMLDRAERAPAPDADSYGAATTGEQMAIDMAAPPAERPSRGAEMDDEIPF